MPVQYKILIVDDEIAITSTLEQFLVERMNCSVQSAGNGVDALDLLEHQDFDLIIADILMPAMDGFDLFNHVRDLAPGMRFIFMSGQFHPHDPHSGRASSMMTFLGKPFQLKDVQKKVEQMLPPDRADEGVRWMKLFKRRAREEVRSPLPGIDLLDMIRLIMMLHKTGTLTVWMGPVHYALEFDQGELVLARGAETAGREAFVLATSWPFCRQSWAADELSGERNIKESTDSLFKLATQLADRMREQIRRIDQLPFASIPGKDVGPFHFGKIVAEDEIGWILNALLMPGEVPILIRFFNDGINASDELQFELQTEFNYQTYIEREGLGMTYESGYIGKRMYTVHQRPEGVPLSMLRDEGEVMPEVYCAELVGLLFDATKFFYDANVVLGLVSTPQIYWHPEHGFTIAHYRTSWSSPCDPNMFFYLGYVEQLVQHVVGGKERVSPAFAEFLAKLSSTAHGHIGFANEEDFLRELEPFITGPRIPVALQSEKVREALNLKTPGH